MGITNLFSKRQQRLRGEVPDVYKYDELPDPLRVQIAHIIFDGIGESTALSRRNHAGGYTETVYKHIHDLLCREYGLFELRKERTYENSVVNFFLNENSIERALDVIELCFQTITQIHSRYNPEAIAKISPNDAILELNARFKEHGVGFQFESSEIIRVDSEFLHTESVKPALLLLRGDDYKGANDEFLSAHEHYRHSRYKECLVDLNKAFESTMKTICKKRGWTTTPKDNSSKLINICFQNSLLPSYLESEITALRTLLESGIPTIRNKNGGHGQGTDIVTVPAYIARYALNLTASTILFLIEAEIG